MRRYLIYCWRVLRHKWFVLIAGLQIGVPIWQLILHDWDKFSPSILIPYARCFRTLDGKRQYESTEVYWRAVNFHHNRNKHHWQFWVIYKSNGEVKALEMPPRHRKEMLADWMGAGRALGQPDTLTWYNSNKTAIDLHPETRVWIETKLETLFGRTHYGN